MQQEQDTCRICSGPGEPDQPLFYPCKCSGTIRYIHQDCLKTWLDHSKKTTCDVCKHPYAFTKVYAPDMPDRVPITILVRKFAEQIIFVILFMLRTVLVAFVWLTLLPYGTLLIWRVFFFFGNLLAWFITSHTIIVPGPGSSPEAPHISTIAANTTVLLDFYHEEVFLPFIRSLPGDIFTGQIIASLIVLVFLAVFLLREWIQQNARPGVFDDVAAQEEAAAGRQRNIAQLPAPENDQGPPAVEGQVGEAHGAPAQEGDDEDGRDTPQGRDRRRAPDVPSDVATDGQSSDSEIEDVSIKYPEGYLDAIDAKLEHRSNRLNEFKRKAHVMQTEPEETEGRLQKRWEQQARKNSAASLGSLSYSAEDASTSNGTIFLAPGEGKGKKRAIESDGGSSDTEEPPPRPFGRTSFQFTFQAPIPSSTSTIVDFGAPPNSQLFTEFSDRAPLESFKFGDTDRLAGEPFSPSPQQNGFRSPFDAPLPTFDRVTQQELPFPLTPRTSVGPETSEEEDGESKERMDFPQKGTSSLSLPTKHARFTRSEPDDDEESIPGTSPNAPIHVQAGPSRLQSPPRRPPLPVSILPSSEQLNAEVQGATGNTPLPSPSLATYQAPEELAQDYFGHPNPPAIEENDVEDEDEDEEEGRFTDYFVEPKEANVQPNGHHAAAALVPDSDEDEEDRGHGHNRQRRDQLEVQQNPPAVQEGAAGEQDLDDDDRDQNLDEDLDGAMEAVGLRGPIFAVFQNASLMFFILTVTIGAAIWIPYTLGKTVVLLTLEPRRALQLLHLPIRAVRLVTDPTVDAVVFCMRFIALTIMGWCLSLLKKIDFIGLADRTVKDAVSPGIVSSMSKYFNLNRIVSLLNLSSPPKAALPPVPTSSVWTSMTNSFWSFARLSQTQPPPITRPPPPSFADHWIYEYAEDAFAALGKHVRFTFTSASKRWTQLAEYDGTIERVWATFLGYCVAAFLAALYLNTFTVGNVKTAGRAVRSAIRQQMIVVKVGLFIIVELVAFPFGCGIMLDYSTLPIFPEVSIETRVAFFWRAPVTASFYHWLIGTMFMYQFAILLATCRELLRPGCMWFIKDPQDPTFHPIRDILDRPTFAQLRKLGLSAVMYGVVIVLGVGGVISTLAVIIAPAFPLRWKMRVPLSEIPIDLLFVHLVLPPTLHYFRPRKPFKKLLTLWWRWTSKQLRLTSYMFGDRHPDEEFSRPWNSYLPWHRDVAPVIIPSRDGGFRRVPAGDNIAFLRDRPAMIQVDETGVPLSEGGKELLAEQDAEARQAGRNPSEDYAVVYIPPDFLKRIFAFIAFFWISGSIALFAGIAIPTFAGRSLFRLFTERELHDGYSFMIGFYLIWWSWLVGILFVKVRIRRQRHMTGREELNAVDSNGGRIRASWLLFLFKRVTVYFSKILWLGFWLGFILPMLLSIVVDLYIVIPLRSIANPGFTPTIHLFESWATGLILAKIMMKVHRPRPGTDFNGGLEAIRRNGWRRPDPWNATKDFIAPAVAGLTGMIMLPPQLVFVASKVVVLSMPIEDINRLVYPAIFVIVATCQFVMSLTGVFSKWAQSIRDKEFLVELRLRNLEQPQKEGDKPTDELMEYQPNDAEDDLDG